MAAAPARPVLIAMLHNVLRSEIHGYESGFDRVTTYQAAVGVDELLERTRTSAINILKSMFGTAETDAERLIIIQAMTAATKIADAGEGSKDLKLLVLRDSLTVVQFYTEIASELSYKLQQDPSTTCYGCIAAVVPPSLVLLQTMILLQRKRSSGMPSWNTVIASIVTTVSRSTRF